MRKNQPAFLIVDDDAAFSQAMGWALEGQGFSVRFAHDIGSAVKSATSAPPDFAIVDLKDARGIGLNTYSRPKIHEFSDADFGSDRLCEHRDCGRSN